MKSMIHFNFKTLLNYSLCSAFTLLLLFATVKSYSATIYSRANTAWDVTSTWSIVAPGGVSCACTPAVGDSVVIDGYQIDLNAANVTIAALYLTNLTSIGDTYLKVALGKKLTVTSNIWLYFENQAEPLELILVDDGSEIEVQGNIYFERVAANNKSLTLRLQMFDRSYMNVLGNFTFNYLNSANSENNFDIDMRNYARLDVGGDMAIRLADGNDYEVNLVDSSIVNVTGNVTVTQDGGDILMFKINDESSFIVGGDLTMTINGGNDFQFKIGPDTLSTVIVDVTADFYLNHNGGDDMTFDMENFAIMTIGGLMDINIAGTTTDLLTLTMIENSRINVGGNLNMTAGIDNRLSMNMSDNTVFSLGGSIVRQASPSDFGSLSFSGDAELILSGTTHQVIAPNEGAGTDEITYNKLTFNNTYGVSPQLSLISTVLISKELTLIDGVLLLGSYNIIIGSASTVTGGSQDSYVIATVKDGGRMSRLTGGNFSMNFAVGDDDEYSPVIYTQNNAGGDSLHVSVADSLHPNLDTTGGGAYISRFWRIDSDGYSSTNYDLSYFYKDTDIVEDESSLWSARWNGTTWDAFQPVIDATNNLVTITGLNLVPIDHDWTGVSLLVLPVTLVSFEVKSQGKEASINWVTASEHNNDYFTVERSANGVDFEILATIAAAGYKSSEAFYSLIDEQPLNGTSYYRLTQTDFDGTSETFKIVSLSLLSTTTEFNVNPNPSNGYDMTLSITDAMHDEILVVLYDFMGQQVYSKIVVLDNGSVVIAIDPYEQLAKGVYMVIGSSDESVYKKKLIIE